MEISTFLATKLVKRDMDISMFLAATKLFKRNMEMSMFLAN